jgi:hypothetical protein
VAGKATMSKAQTKAQAKAETKTEKKAEKAAKKERAKGKRVWKLLNSGSAVAAGMVTAKALNATWKTATGHEPPAKPEHPDLGAREAIAWAALSGMAIGVAKVYATRRAAVYWVKSTGRLPPGMSTKAYKKVRQSQSQS